ncbi:sialomucin core protein 24-like [Megalops cyprinoides]|uniref:sialomucin core protein 24-like n=1 Tax=Megalops cyprinoides TaxID=118141 RepID=UPI001863DD80|nr:sialomucin core protein 24-like [Megalops cyprinoides]
MSSARCLHHLLFSVSILLAVTFGTPSISNPLGRNIPDNRNATSSDLNGTTQLPISSTQSGSISPTAFPSSTQLNVVTTPITQDSTSNSTVTATNLPSSTKESISTTETSLNSTPDDPNATATTLLSETTALAHTTGFTTPSNSSTNQPQPASTATSISASTSQVDHTTLTATGISTAKPPPSTTTNSTTQVEGKPHELSYSEKAMTIFFSVLLGVAILAVVVYSLTRCRREGTQFMHRPLYNNSEEPGEQLSGFSGADRYVARDDTLVISGGLYDGPEVFNPAMTTEEDVGFHSDQLPYAPGPAQFRLEFLPDDRERSPNHMASTFETFQPLEDEP